MFGKHNSTFAVICCSIKNKADDSRGTTTVTVKMCMCERHKLPGQNQCIQSNATYHDSPDPGYVMLRISNHRNPNFAPIAYNCTLICKATFASAAKAALPMQLQTHLPNDQQQSATASNTPPCWNCVQRTILYCG